MDYYIFKFCISYLLIDFLRLKVEIIMKLGKSVYCITYCIIFCSSKIDIIFSTNKTDIVNKIIDKLNRS